MKNKKSKVSNFIALFSGFLIFAGILILGTPATASIPATQDRLISLNFNDLDFSQAMEAIASQTGVTIRIHGEKPSGKRSLSLKQVPLRQAIDQVMRLYNIQNHAASVNPETGSVMVAIVKTSTMVASQSPLRLHRKPRIDISEDKPLTAAQLDRLREQSAIIVAELEEASRPLTEDQLERLRNQNAAIEDEMENDQPLTQDQLDRLRAQSAAMEAEMEAASGPLSPDQLERLREQSRRIQAEEDRAAQPLTEEQLRRLREQEQQ